LQTDKLAVVLNAVCSRQQLPRNRAHVLIDQQRVDEQRAIAEFDLQNNDILDVRVHAVSVAAMGASTALAENELRLKVRSKAGDRFYKINKVCCARRAPRCD
jgi:hypothetical protein